MFLSVDIESTSITGAIVGLAVLLAHMLNDAIANKKTKHDIGMDIPGLEGSRLRAVERLAEDSTSRLDRQQKRLLRMEEFLMERCGYDRD